jgi:predicted GNAT superfamily acetyltransferase
MAAPASNTIQIHEIVDEKYLRDAERLQKEVWEIPDLDVVPLTQMIAATHAGGIVIGAFDGDLMVGFAYGFVGLEDGKMTHHSHMVAVKKEYRGRNIGYRLKLVQRGLVIAQGITEMTWTFDPLQSRNANFNFTRLGVICDSYLVDLYGSEAASSLHQNGTDRLWVSWRLKSQPVIERLEGNWTQSEPQQTVPLVTSGENDAPIFNEIIGGTSANAVSIEIPASIGAIERRDKKLAGEWRTATRQAFLGAFLAGFFVSDFIRNDETGRYRLLRKDEGEFFRGGRGRI